METAIPPHSSARFEGFELNLLTGELYRHGVKLKIRGHPIDVLAILVEHPGELVTRETLRKHLWPENTFVDFEHILNNSVRKLREVLGDEAESPRFIETLPRQGYRFIAPVEKTAATAPQAPETSNQAASAPPTANAAPSVLQIAHSGLHRISTHWIARPVVALAVASAAVGFLYVRSPLPAPRITHYEQLTLDGRRKIAQGTDGSRIYAQLIHPGKDIVQIPISGGKLTEISINLPGGNEAFGGQNSSGLYGVSPDGLSLLVANQCTSREGCMVWVVGAQGYTARYLTRAVCAAWSPDGRIVVYASPRGDIYAIPASGGAPRLLYRENAPASPMMMTRDISWSPDGTTIRFSRWGGRVFEISSTGANLHEWLPGWNGSVQKCCGRWTPGGQFFVFLAGRTLEKGPAYRPLAQIWAVDERHGEIRPRIAEPILLASEPMLWGHPIPSRGGDKIIARGVSQRGELERFDPASKNLEPYWGGVSAEMPDFSHDGKYGVYVSFPDGILWRANRDGTGLVQLTEPPFYPKNPHWSPDGTQILFTDNTHDGVDAIYVVSSLGGTPKRLFPEEDGPQSLADWSPGGRRVVYSTFGAFSFVRPGISKAETRIVELATGRLTVLPERPGGFWAPLWSPDGRYIAGQSFDGRELVVFDVKTGKWEIVAEKLNIGNHNWSHDGRLIYFICWDQDNFAVYRVAVSGHKAELVFDLPENFRGAGWYDFGMSLDPADAPLLLRDVGTDEIYALTLEEK